MPALRSRLIAAVAAAVFLGGLGWGVWSLLRSPVEGLSQDTSALSARKPEVLPRPARPPRPSEAYVGSLACAECHGEIHDRYRQHPMGRSLAHVSEASPVGDYSAENTFNAPPSILWDLTTRYYVERDEHGVRHHEVLLEPDGAVIYDQSVPIHYEVGSGQRGRSYLTNRDGLLFMSPISWYSQHHRWDLSPGYQKQNPGFERQIADGCITCHAGRMAPVGVQPDRFHVEPFIEPAIGCERCHGPGAEHVAMHRSAAAGDTDPIVNPADLTPRQRDSVCFQCHLQGEERFTRYGRTEYDFRPGDEISDIWAIFVRGTGVASDRTTEAVSQVEQMLASACYRQSAGTMSCTSCHDPHGLPAPEERVAFYRARCVECHGSGAAVCALPVPRRLEVTAEDSCIECHMPKVAANDVPHTSQTDHRVLRTYDGEQDALPATSPRLRIFGADRIPAPELERARALMMITQTEKSSDYEVLAAEVIRKLQPWHEAAPDDLLATEALGMAYYLNRDVDMAFRVWDQALSRSPDHEDILRRLVVVCHEHGRLEQGVEYARRLVALNPWNHMYFGRLAHMLGQLNRFPEGIEAAHRALELKPSNAAIHGWLGEAYQIRGNADRSQHHRLLFEKLRRKERR